MDDEDSRETTAARNEARDPGATNLYTHLDREAIARAEQQVLSEWKVGDVLLDLYEVTGILGEGGMGKVYKVHHRGWDTELAAKSPRPEIFASSGGRENFVREAETWANLGLHPHTVSCYYVRVLGGIPRVFAEYVEGGSLSDWIGTKKLYEGGPEKALERILDISIQFAWGLQFAHEQGLVHQDVKPANVMMTPDGTAKVTDFGLARARGVAGERSMTGTADKGRSILVSAGGMTPAYCSPEQAAKQPLSRRTDIWSWGLSVLEMFTGEVTWLAGQSALPVLEEYLRGEETERPAPKMPTQVAELLRHCFEENPEARPRDFGAVVTNLREIYQQQTGQA
jgi:serine/threonine protein kinase